MDKIFINKMEFYGYHGVLEEEKKLGQHFIIDLIIETNLKRAGQTDDLNYTINYAEIFNLCKNIVEGKAVNLIETVAEKIADQLLRNYMDINKCTITVTKPNPPIKGHYESVAVEITRSRND